MSAQETPASLNEAGQPFSRFLRENGYPEQVLWVEHGDIVWHRRQLWVRMRPIQTAQERACQRYADGIRNGLGVTLYAFRSLQERRSPLSFCQRTKTQHSVTSCRETALSSASQRRN